MVYVQIHGGINLLCLSKLLSFSNRALYSCGQAKTIRKRCLVNRNVFEKGEKNLCSQMKTDTFGQGVKCQVFYRAPVLAFWSNKSLITLSTLALLNFDTQINCSEDGWSQPSPSPSFPDAIAYLQYNLNLSPLP